MHVLLLDDLPAARALLQDALALAFPDANCHCAADLQQAQAALPARSWDLALVDLGLPDGNGIDFITTLRRSQPDCCAVVVTVTGDDETLFAALAAGAQGYLLKDRPAPELARTLRGLRDGQPPLSPAIARRLMAHFQQTAPVPEAPVLTEREREVLAQLARGLRVADIAAALGISAHTVGDHVKHIYSKLGIRSRAAAALHARQMGLA